MNEYITERGQQALKIISEYPVTVRRVIYPNGLEVMQGAYRWTQGFDGGTLWKDLPLIPVGNDGREMVNG